MSSVSMINGHIDSIRSSNIKPLNPCPMCKDKSVLATYEENARYRYKCRNCGQYFEFNAPSQLAADVIYNSIVASKKEGT